MSDFAQVALTLPRAIDRAERFTRLLLQPPEVCSIDNGFRQARVLSGTAWITSDGRDHVVRAGESLLFPAARGARPLMSALGGKPLAVELLG